MRRLIQTISFKNFASMQYEAEKGSLLIDVFIDEIIKFSNSEYCCPLKLFEPKN